MQLQKGFAEHIVQVLKEDENVIGIAAGGSWITNSMDEFSDLDLVLVTTKKIGGDKAAMLGYAERFGHLLNGFTGEHVGEPRLLICLYNDPLLHVDTKFVTLEEFHERVEDPCILLDKEGRLKQVLETTTASYPMPDLQWMEDRFWIWVHYALLKIGRGELFEAYDFFSFIRLSVLGPLLHIKNGRLPRGVRKVETDLMKEDLQALQATLCELDKGSLLASLMAAVNLYRDLRKNLFDGVLLQTATERNVMDYFGSTQSR